MKYISSDTNVWIDYDTIGKLELPFKLEFEYLMNEDTIDAELLNGDMRERLLSLGLVETRLSEEEFFLAEEFKRKYKRLSIYDCIALAIAKCRNIALLSGDGPMRKAAKQEGVEVIGTIGILDMLYEERLILKEEYIYCLEKLRENIGGKIRLPLQEIINRLEKVR